MAGGELYVLPKDFKHQTSSKQKLIGKSIRAKFSNDFLITHNETRVGLEFCCSVHLFTHVDCWPCI